MCPECGGLVAFADDSTVTITDSDPYRLTEKLLVLTSSRKRQNETSYVCINIPTEVITRSQTGVWIYEDMR